MNPYVSCQIQSLAESEQQFVRHFQRRFFRSINVGMRSFYSLSLRYIVGRFQRQKLKIIKPKS